MTDDFPAFLTHDRGEAGWCARASSRPWSRPTAPAGGCSSTSTCSRGSQATSRRFRRRCPPRCAHRRKRRRERGGRGPLRAAGGRVAGETRLRRLVRRSASPARTATPPSPPDVRRAVCIARPCPCAGSVIRLRACSQRARCVT